jgi:hypothetical protein
MPTAAEATPNANHTRVDEATPILASVTCPPGSALLAPKGCKNRHGCATVYQNGRPKGEIRILGRYDIHFLRKLVNPVVLSSGLLARLLCWIIVYHQFLSLTGMKFPRHLCVSRPTHMAKAHVRLERGPETHFLGANLVYALIKPKFVFRDHSLLICNIFLGACDLLSAMKIARRLWKLARQSKTQIVRLTPGQSE